MRIVLEVIHGPRKGRSYIFDRHDTFIVGRSHSVHCAIPEDSALSRDHFMIEIRPPICDLRDLDSTNGTFVNERRTDRARLQSGDRIVAGQSTFLVKVETPPADESGSKFGLSGPVLAQIKCIGCGAEAPATVDVTSGTGFDYNQADDRIEWLCELCRAEVAASPQPVPHYTLIRELGRGGMGVVYQARNNNTGRMVALKLLVPEIAATRSAVDRFLREMTVVSKLKHVNIVEWLEQGMTRGQFWFAMEFVAGLNLEALANASPGRYPIHQACRMACHVLKGLEHAHAQGFVHRDIKPENILIGRGDTGLIAKISDFGLAKSYRGLGLSGLTFSGEMRGTIPFMPPEQMLDFRAVLPAGDLYSTAATLYYLITAKFIHDHQGEGGDMIRMLLEEPMIPIQSRRPEVPSGLARVLDRCLAREPADRYPSAAAMRRALRDFC